MSKKHAKSPCCGDKIIRFGGKRRQCVDCRKTWRIRKSTRGKKRKRLSKNSVVSFLNHTIPTLRALALLRHKSTSAMERRMSLALNKFLADTPWPVIPEEKDLIVIADAMVVYLEKKWHTWHFLLVRPTDGNEAIILPPYHQPGTETGKSWREAFASAPKDILSRVRAIICDGHRGLVSEAKWKGWILQRCHFHLIARVQGRRSKWKSGRRYQEGKLIYGLVKTALTTANQKVLGKTISTLEEMGWRESSPELKKVLLGFVNNHKDFRAYLLYPELKLPTTSNTAESLIGCVQALMHRARGFRTIVSAEKWISAVIKNKQKIKCNGFRQPN